MFDAHDCPCPNCDPQCQKLVYYWVEFKNKTEHLSCDCQTCGTHISYVPKTEKNKQYAGNNRLPWPVKSKSKGERKDWMLSLPSLPIDSVDKTLADVVQKALDYATHRCQICNNSYKLIVHKRYGTEGDDPKDLVVLCSACRDLLLL